MCFVRDFIRAVKLDIRLTFDKYPLQQKTLIFNETENKNKPSATIKCTKKVRRNRTSVYCRLIEYNTRSQAGKRARVNYQFNQLTG